MGSGAVGWGQEGHSGDRSLGLGKGGMQWGQEL